MTQHFSSRPPRGNISYKQHSQCWFAHCKEVFKHWTFVYHLLSVMKIQTFIKRTQFIVFRNLEVIINNNYFILCVIYCAYSPKFDCVFKSVINFKWMYVAFQFWNIVSLFLNLLLSLLWRSSSQLRADIKQDLLFLTDST